MIRILEKHVADKIAAGEVIDRPVSIIKELLENSLDAGASNITVEIRNGGKSYIRVTDNGCGIPADEAARAFERHATSKITSAGDLDSIATLGFRGEALASICAVSRVELITKTPENSKGHKVVVEGNSILENTAIGCPDGTTVTVRDLFYNVPARQKFLSSDNGETRRIIDMVSRIALSYGDVKISLVNGSSNVFTTQGKGNIFNSIISVYGSDIGRDLLPVESSRDGFTVKGFVSSPASSAASRSRQIFCVNGRVISSKVMERALDGAYKEKLFHGRFPIAFLFLAMPPEKLDVNIHPTKKEVRFDDNFEVEDFVKKAVIKALTQKEALPQIRAENDNISHIKVAEVNTGAENFKAESSTFSQDSKQVDIKNILTTLREKKEKIQPADDVPHTDIDSAVTSDEMIPEKPGEFPFDFMELKYMGAIFSTYIMATDEDSFYLIDQHAAHERVFYERILNQYNSSEKASQQLLIPLSFNVGAAVNATESSWIDKVKSIGYNIEFFGNNTYIVREIPAFMELREAEDFLSDMFKELEGRPDLTSKKILDKIIMKSCKNAVKGGDHLDDREITALMDQLKKCVNPFSCPHGRPTFIRMTKYEIEKMFKRV